MAEHTEPRKPAILIVEDHTGLRETLGTWLTGEYPDVSIEMAATGEEAVAMAGRLKPDIILLDIRLPGINGIEAMKEIFRRGLLTDVVIITSQSEEIYSQEAMNAGARSFIQKRRIWKSLPVIIGELLQ